VIKNDRAFAEAYAKMEAEKYKELVADMCRTLFDRDTAPGAEPEDMLKLDIPALVIPGHDASHATSAARYLEECLPKAQYWDVLRRDKQSKLLQHGCWSSWKGRLPRRATGSGYSALICTLRHLMAPPGASLGRCQTAGQTVPAETCCPAR